MSEKLLRAQIPTYIIVPTIWWHKTHQHPYKLNICKIMQTIAHQYKALITNRWGYFASGTYDSITIPLCPPSQSALYSRYEYQISRLRSSPALKEYRISSRHNDGKYLTRWPSKEDLRWQQTWKLIGYRESTHTILSVTYPYPKNYVTRIYETFLYSDLEHINTTSMHTVSR